MTYKVKRTKNIEEISLQKKCPYSKFSGTNLGKYTAYKVSVFGVILVRIFPHLD